MSILYISLLETENSWLRLKRKSFPRSCSLYW